MPAVSPLDADAALTHAARLHAYDMGDKQYLDHNSLDGKDPWERMADAGYDGSPYGENIAAGSDNADGTLEQWLTSDGHCRNLMSAEATEMGLGYAFVDNSPYGHYWVQVLGTR
jgi:uncharacterized protein YkwD